MAYFRTCALKKRANFSRVGLRFGMRNGMRKGIGIRMRNGMRNGMWNHIHDLQKSKIQKSRKNPVIQNFKMIEAKTPKKTQSMAING